MYSAANIEGLIEINSHWGERFSNGRDEALLSAALTDLDGSMPCAITVAQGSNQSVTADFDRLQQELAASFGDLLKRLFEGE